MGQGGAEKILGFPHDAFLASTLRLVSGHETVKRFLIYLPLVDFYLRLGNTGRLLRSETATEVQGDRSENSGHNARSGGQVHFAWPPNVPGGGGLSGSSQPETTSARPA